MKIAKELICIIASISNGIAALCAGINGEILESNTYLILALLFINCLKDK